MTLTASANNVVRNGVTLLGVDSEAITKSFSKSGFSLGDSKAPPKAKKANAAKRAPALSSLKGYYYTTDFGTSVPLSVTHKYMVQITPFATDSVEIYNLMGGQKTVKGVYDASSGTIKVKAQVTYVDNTYGSLYCCVVDLDKKVYYTDREIEFSVSDDGNITVGSWGIFVISGANKGVQIVNSKSKLYKANAMITDHSLSQTTDSLKVRTYPACYSRESKTQIAVRNFYNCGAEVVINIDSTGVATMPHQALAKQGYTSYYNYCISSYTSPTVLTLKASGLTGSFSGSTITFGRWAFSSSTNKSYIVESLEKSEISTPEEFVPFSTALTLKGSGSQADPYLVTSAQDIEAIANANNHNAGYKDSGSNVFSGAFFKQTADIDMASVENHEPIGIAKLPFNGTYDGQGHKILNLSQNRRDEFNAGLFGLLGDNASVSNITFVNPSINTAKSKAGVVAGESNGSVSNITITGGYVGNAAFYAGGVVGMNYGTVTNTAYSGTIEGESMVGGVIGVSYGTVNSSWSDATINLTASKGNGGGVCGSASRATTQFNDCYFTGVINDSFGNGNIGGIVGYIYQGSVNRCWNGGQLNSSYTSAHTGKIGGIAGHNLGGKLNDCYNSGIVRSFTSDIVGGLVGTLEKGKTGTTTSSDAPEINGCLNTGVVLCAPSAQNNEIAAVTAGDSVIIKNSYFDGQACFNGSTQHSLSTAELTSGEAPEGFNASAWTLAAGHYPQIAKFAATDKAKLDAVPFTLKAGETVKRMKSSFSLSTDNNVTWSLFNGGQLSTTGHGLKLNGNNVAVTATSVVSDTLTAMRGSDFRIYILKVVPDEFSGQGSEADPYLIKTKDDILKIKNAVDVQIYDYTGVCFKLANDIDMGGKSDFFGIGVHGADYGFNGTLDGDGHSIKNWNVNRSFSGNGGYISGYENALAALFIYTGHKSVIKNLNIASDCSILGGSYVAGVACYNAGTIENCRNFATVKAVNKGAAGIVGYNAANATVSGCYNAGTVVSGGSNAAGIVSVNYGVVDLSQNDGTVNMAVLTAFQTDSTKLATAGGVVGENNATVTNSLNQGYVAGGTNVGGVIGYNAYSTTSSGLLSTGVVRSFDNQKTLGAVFGYYSTNASVSTEKCGFDSQLAGKNAGNALAINGVEAYTTAKLTSGDSIPGFDKANWAYAKGLYPVLKAFADEPAAAFNRANYIVFVSGEKNDSRFSVKNASQVVAQQGVTVALAKGKNFTLSGNTINLAAITEVERDTLSFTSSQYVKQYPLFAAPKMLPNGDGTKAKPWQIASVADWQTVAKYSKDYEASFDGEYFLLVNNLDFKSDTTASLMLVDDGATSFQGHFEGNGKTIDGFAFFRDNSTTGVNKGLFGLVGEKGVIENLTLGSKSSINGYQYIGGFAGRSSGTMRNCVNHAKVTTNKMGFVGGLVGVANAKARFYNCQNYGTVTSANGQSAGIAGQTDADVALDSCANYGIISGKYSNGGIVGSSSANVTNCFNDGPVTSSEYNAGGIIGYNALAGTVVSGCENTGIITTKTYGAGGIVGNLFRPGTVKHSVNQGDVEAGTYGAGGIVGNTGTTPQFVIDSCANYGSVACKSYQAGGIVGVANKGTAALTNVVSNCVNYGTVSSVNKYNAGGIVGETKLFVNVTNNVNYGTVNSAYQAGGIVGLNAGNIQKCFNAGAVQARYSLGGVAGSSSGELKESGNAGNIVSLGTSASTSYNVGGVLGTGKTELLDVYNHGKVQGYKQVGGIIGLPVKNYTTVTNAYNTGAVVCSSEADSASCGNVCGGKAIANVTTTNVFYDVQNVTGIYANDTSAVALSTAGICRLSLDSTWTSRPNCYPVPAALADSGIVNLYSAALVLDSLDTRDAVTKAFWVGKPNGITWTVSDNLSLGNDGRVALANINVGETATLRASIDGDNSHFLEYTLTLLSTSGTEQIDAHKEIDHVEYVNIAGIVSSHPFAGVNVVRTFYTDGTTSTKKVVISQKN